MGRIVKIDETRVAALIEQVRSAPGVFDCCKADNALLVFVDTENASRYLGICRKNGHKHVRAFPVSVGVIKESDIK
jgi:hypothetical protein